MTIAARTTAVTMLGNGSNRKFPFTFRAWEGEIRVVLTDPEEKNTDVTGLSDIVLNAGGGLGGMVTYPAAGGAAALPAGWKITVLRDMDFLQPVRLLNAARFDPIVMEQSLDRLTATDQQLSEKLDRAITLAEGAAQAPAILLDKIFTAENNAISAATAAADSANGAAASEAQAGQSATAAEASAQTAQAAEAAATDSEDLARKWAENPRDTPVRGEDEFSAYHWAQEAEDAAATLPDVSQASVGDTLVTEVGPGGEMVARWQPPPSGLPPQRKDEKLLTAIPAGGTWTVPQYTVGSKKLKVYLGGVLATPGAPAVGFYQEAGAAGSKSTAITINNALDVGRELAAEVAG